MVEFPKESSGKGGKSEVIQELDESTKRVLQLVCEHPAEKDFVSQFGGLLKELEDAGALGKARKTFVFNIVHFRYVLSTTNNPDERMKASTEFLHFFVSQIDYLSSREWRLIGALAAKYFPFVPEASEDQTSPFYNLYVLLNKIKEAYPEIQSWIDDLADNVELEFRTWAGACLNPASNGGTSDGQVSAIYRDQSPSGWPFRK